MRFYRIEADVAGSEAATDRRRRQEQCCAFQEKTEAAYSASADMVMPFVSFLRDGHIVCGILAKAPCDVSASASAFLDELGLSAQNVKVKETTIKGIVSLLRTASRNDYIEDEDNVLPLFGLDTLELGSRSGFTEELLDGPVGITQMKRQARALPCRLALTAELERIYAAPKAAAFLGHPVHYMIQSGDAACQKRTAGLLLSALWTKGRITNGRYSIVTLQAQTRSQHSQLAEIYAANLGGAVVVSWEDGADGQELVRCMQAHRNDVLTVLCLPEDVCAKRLSEDMPFLVLRDDRLDREQAKQYLQSLAKGRGVSGNRALYHGLDAGVLYTPTELKSIFDAWFTRRMQTEIYPQYAFLSQRHDRPDKSAYDRLQELIGLGEVKTVIRQALDYFQMQKLRSQRGLPCERPSMHMVFKGNPGTAKTTVARLLAQIMKDEGLLPGGGLVEVGRADLVGRYTGWTADNVRRKFREARGGVLFIDEAYSLVEEHAGSYGDEAINAIVQEMENHREDTVVIFAGYPREMETFLDRNPGLRSRVAFHVLFPDYTPEELYAIGELTARDRGMRLTPDAREKLLGILSKARGADGFGNGRTVRNIIEQAMMRQASRLTGSGTPTDEALSFLTVEDIGAPEEAPRPRRPIGFNTGIARQCAL